MRSRVSIFAAALIALSGCAAQVEVPTYADITFKASQPIALDVASVSSRTTFVEPLVSPHVGHEFPVKLAPTAARWAADRIQTVGQSGSVLLTVIEASAVEEELEKSTGLKGFVTDDQAQLYTVKIVATLQAENAATSATAKTTVSVSRSRSVAEGASFNDREAVWYRLTEEVMADYNMAMGKAVGEHLGLFLVR